MRPQLVCEVRYSSRTIDGVLRFPVFIRLRDDKTAEDMRREAESLDEMARLDADSAATEAASGASGPAEPKISNPDKIFYPEDGYTKKDLIDLYRDLAPWLMPYLADRPVVLTRYPDGIHGKNFFQKDAPTFIPGWVRTERMWSPHAKREIDYFICENIESLVYIINLASIPLHVWSSRISNLENRTGRRSTSTPKGAPFANVIAITVAIKELCDSIGLPAYAKTTGSSGMHVLVPLGGQCTYDQARGIAELISRVIVHDMPDIATLVRPSTTERARSTWTL